jgi:hypothetical protein
MGYGEALQAAGARLIDYRAFGDYQGSWWAKVAWRGQIGFVHGAFGSCSGCDAFEAEFGDREAHAHGFARMADVAELARRRASDPQVELAAATLENRCLDCLALADRLACFGENYLDGLMTAEAAIAAVTPNVEWDHDASEVVAWLTDLAE